MVLKVALQDSLQPGTGLRHRFVPLPVQCIANRCQSCPHALLRREANDLKPPFSVGSTAVREPQKVKRFRSPLSPDAPPLGRKPSELNQSRFVGVQD